MRSYWKMRIHFKYCILSVSFADCYFAMFGMIMIMNYTITITVEIYTLRVGNISYGESLRNMRTCLDEQTSRKHAHRTTSRPLIAQPVLLKIPEYSLFSEICVGEKKPLRKPEKTARKHERTTEETRENSEETLNTAWFLIYELARKKIKKPIH